jgi:hypothetical protein
MSETGLGRAGLALWMWEGIRAGLASFEAVDVAEFDDASDSALRYRMIVFAPGRLPMSSQQSVLGMASRKLSVVVS